MSSENSAFSIQSTGTAESARLIATISRVVSVLGTEIRYLSPPEEASGDPDWSLKDLSDFTLDSVKPVADVMSMLQSQPRSAQKPSGDREETSEGQRPSVTLVDGMERLRARVSKFVALNEVSADDQGMIEGAYAAACISKTACQSSSFNVAKTLQQTFFHLSDALVKALVDVEEVAGLKRALHAQILTKVAIGNAIITLTERQLESQEDD